jgi:hypothetical protein
MFKLNNFFPPIKSLLLRVIAILLASFYGLLGFASFIGMVKDGHLLGLFLGVFFCLFAVSTLRLRYWAFQLTCAVLLCISIFSPFGFFPLYGFEFEANPSVYTQFWRFILFNICTLGFVAIIQFVYEKELIRSL